MLGLRRLETGVSEVLRRLKVNKFADQYANAADDSTPALTRPAYWMWQRYKTENFAHRIKVTCRILAARIADDADDLYAFRWN
jgi:hypothetical protein